MEKPKESVTHLVPDVQHRLTDYDPIHFKGFKGFTYCHKPPKVFAKKTQITVQGISSVPDSEPSILGKLTTLQQGIVSVYADMVKAYIIDFLLETKDRPPGSYCITKKTDYTSLVLKLGMHYVDYDKSLAIREEPIKHNGGCFNFSDGNTLNIWLY